MVDIIREFLAVHASATEFVRRHEEGSLTFEEVEGWVGDDASSELYRLKERCHTMFRPSASDAGLEIREGALLDLTVGSLFHEAMKLRENLYQQERYGPRVAALRREGDRESLDLFAEFEKILATSSVRLDESVAEVQVMLGQTRKQLRRLIVQHGATGIVARSLYETEEQLVCVYPQGLDALYAEIHGDAVSGFVMAAESYLDSAYYGEALAVLAEARRRAPQRKDVERATDYAEGMQAFFSRDYERSVARIGDWLAGGPAADQPDRVRLALAGTSHVEALAEGEAQPDIVRQAAEISAALRALIQPKPAVGA